MTGGKYPNRAEIATGQLAQLRSLVAELIPANSFYTAKLQAEGVTFDIASLEDFCTRFPFTTKAELVEDQLAHPPFGTNLTFPLASYTRFHQTSGTTGAPLRWLDTPESWDGLVESWTTIFRVAGVSSLDRIFFAFTFGPFIGFWLAFAAGQKIGALCLPGGGLGSVARLRMILENEATVLCCTPTYAIRLGEVAAAENISLRHARVKTIIVAGEPGGSVASVRSRVEELWPGAAVFDHHGMTETGPVSFQCPSQPGVLHVIESAYLAELIDPLTGGALPPGEVGELVLTTLGRTASPLLRYRTGDQVRAIRPGKACVCGRVELALEGGILGRVDDMLVVRGVNIFPSAVEEILRGFSEIAEYQVKIARPNALTELFIRIEPAGDRANGTDLCRRVEKALQTAFNLRIPVSEAPAGTLPRFEMKARRWIRE